MRSVPALRIIAVILASQASVGSAQDPGRILPLTERPASSAPRMAIGVGFTGVDGDARGTAAAIPLRFDLHSNAHLALRGRWTGSLVAMTGPAALISAGLAPHATHQVGVASMSGAWLVGHSSTLGATVGWAGESRSVGSPLADIEFETRVPRTGITVGASFGGLARGHRVAGQQASPPVIVPDSASGRIDTIPGSGSAARGPRTLLLTMTAASAFAQGRLGATEWALRVWRSQQRLRDTTLRSTRGGLDLSLGIERPLNPRVDLTAALSSRPLHGGPGGVAAHVGLRLGAIGPRRPATVALEWQSDSTRTRGKEVTFALRTRHATSVELASDLTGWEPVAMRRIRDDPSRFELRLPATVGVHRLRVRLDGGIWQVPSGVAVETGDFGTVGVLVVR